MRNNINTYADLTAYNADTNKDYPNISYIEGTDEVKWNKYDPDHIVCVYNVTSTSSATKLLNIDWNILEMWIDGVKQESVVSSYTFDTLGEHKVKYGLNENKYITNANFQSCTSLTSVIIPSIVTSIADGNSLNYGAFRSCTNLANVKMLDGITSIGISAFYGCGKLTSLTIPKTVTTIKNTAFQYCSGLINLTIEATTPPTLGNNALQGTNANLVIYVPAESVNIYKSASRWSTYASIIQKIPTT